MKYFKRSEFACRCGCGFDTVDYELAEILDDLREHFGQPVIVTSGCRCTKHNKNVGGAKNSKHLTGRGADIKVSGIKPLYVYNYLDNKYKDKYGIGLYKSWIHIDSRSKKARW